VPLAPPDARDHPDVLLAKARALHALAQEKAAVIERIKAYLEPWKNDKRMRVMGEILLKEIARVEQEEAERSGDRRR